MEDAKISKPLYEEVAEYQNNKYMIFESLKNKKTITAFIKPFGLRLKCKIEEFIKPNMEDESSKDVKYRYKLTAKHKEFTMFFYVDSEKECESWQLQ